MTTRIGDFVYLGNFADVDTDDSNVTIEQPGVLIGQTVIPQMVEVTEFDGADDGIIHIDNYTSRDDLSYDLGSGTVTTDLDSIPGYNVDILLGDGSVLNQNVYFAQMTNGDVFGVGVVWDGLNIQSITINSVNTPLHGYNVGTAFVVGTAVVCFASDTGIATPTGEMPAQALKVGDIVITRTGPKAIRWLNTAHHDHPGAQAPIIFKRNALGVGRPCKALRLSPQHRVLVESDLCRDICGHDRVLVAAKSLLPLRGVRQAKPDRPVTYIHLAFDSHEIVFANGLLAESFWPGQQARRALSARSLLSLHVRAPGLLHACDNGQYTAPVLTGRLRKALVHDLRAGLQADGCAVS